MHTIPCNVRLEFNEITGDSVLFRVHRRAYNVYFQKGQTRTRLGGAGWNRLVARNHFVGAEMLCFSVGEEPKILVAMFNFDEEEEEDEVEASEEGEEVEEAGKEGQEKSIIVAQRSNLTEGELEHLDQILPLAGSYVGVPFVTLLTTTNINRHTMVHFLPNLYIYVFVQTCRITL